MKLISTLLGFVSAMASGIDMPPPAPPTIEVKVTGWKKPKHLTLAELKVVTERAEAKARPMRERAIRRMDAFHKAAGSGRRYSFAKHRRLKTLLQESMVAVAYANELRTKLNRATGATDSATEVAA